jgi:hypothetical protein
MAALASAPPSAVLSTSVAQVPLAISAWCLGTRCGAPIAATHRVAFAKLGETVHVLLKFVPRTAKVEVGGIRMKTAISGRELSWVVRRGGGVAVRVTSTRGFVAYVGRLRLR